MCFHHIVNYIESFAQSPHHYFLAVWKTSHLSLTFFALTIPNAQKTTISQKIKRNWATLESVKVEFSALCYMLLCLFAFFFERKRKLLIDKEILFKTEQWVYIIMCGSGARAHEIWEAGSEFNSERLDGDLLTVLGEVHRDEKKSSEH